MNPVTVKYVVGMFGSMPIWCRISKKNIDYSITYAEAFQLVQKDGGNIFLEVSSEDLNVKEEDVAKEINHLFPEQMVKWIKTHGCPTDNVYALTLWKILGKTTLNINELQASKIYNLCGYRWKQLTFPLAKKNKR